MKALDFGQMVTRAVDRHPYEKVELSHVRHYHFDLDSLQVHLTYTPQYSRSNRSDRWSVNRVSVQIGDEHAAIFYGRVGSDVISEWHWSADYADLSDEAKVQFQIMFAEFAV